MKLLLPDRRSVPPCAARVCAFAGGPMLRRSKALGLVPILATFTIAFVLVLTIAPLRSQDSGVSRQRMFESSTPTPTPGQFLGLAPERNADSRPTLPPDAANAGTVGALPPEADPWELDPATGALYKR